MLNEIMLAIFRLCGIGFAGILLLVLLALGVAVLKGIVNVIFNDE